MVAKACALALFLLIPSVGWAGTLHGEFVIGGVVDPVNGQPDTNAFDDLVGTPIAFDIHFDAIQSVSHLIGSDGKLPTLVITGPVRVTFGSGASPLLVEMIGPSIDGTSLRFTIENDPFRHEVSLYSLSFGGAADTVSFTFELGTTNTSDFADVPLDGQGYPILADFGVEATSLYLRRFLTGVAMTDFCWGTAGLTLSLDGAVGAQGLSVGALKLRFR
jgi:TM2 domain-containing membrane protein YozV